jgi:DNA phosphorothioation-associated putative methyltransferase
MTTPVARHRTAMSRTALSRPLATAATDQLLKPGTSIFDYGCGRGDDLRHLQALGYDANGWDPTHRPEACRHPADIVNLGYVINVIEHPGEREQVLRNAWDLARQALIISARLSWDARPLTGQPLGDGLITRTGTFQKFYEQAELAAWIEETLGIQPHAAAPGIFYVFRDLTLAQQFIANRVYRYRPRISIDPHTLYETHREILTPLFDFLSDHARAPRAGELTTEHEQAIQTSLGSISHGVRLIRRATPGMHWEQVTTQRKAELLIYVALSRFGRRPRFSQLGTTLAADIRALFGTYKSACVQADRLLLACGDPAMILITARNSKVGKQTPSALYVHRAALAELPPLLQVYEGCARVLTGTVEGANLIKLSVMQSQISYLKYPQFDRDAHPTLAAAVTVNLKKLTVDWRDYSRSNNPPLLHRKEEFIGSDDPRRTLYSKLTRAEHRAGLYDHPEQIGTWRGWQATLADAGLTIRGHRLIRGTSTMKTVPRNARMEG